MSRAVEPVITVRAHTTTLSVVVDRAALAEDCCVRLIQLAAGDRGEFLAEYGGDWLAATNALVEAE